MLFKLTCLKPEAPNSTKIFYYDNSTGLLHDHEGCPVGEPELDITAQASVFQANASYNPIRKTNSPSVLKIQLGLTCNYSCSYCLQKYVPRADSTAASHVDGFIKSLQENLEGEPKVIQLWGGEPLVYIKTLIPLVSRLRSLYPSAKISMITNGTLLDTNVINWIIESNISISISHDGPGQNYRGPDPFEDPIRFEVIKELYWRKKNAGDPITIGAMIHVNNPDRAAISEWMQDKFQDPDIRIGEGGIIETYDSNVKATYAATTEEHYKLRDISFRNIRYGADKNFGISTLRLEEWMQTMHHGRYLDSIGMRCGMDRDDTLTLDLYGNVITCQNTSISSCAPNGESHHSGNINDLASVKVTTSRHFLKRDDCKNCPVVQACKGGCMFLEGELFDVSCENLYTDHISFFASAVESLTGYAPVYIEDTKGTLQEHRKDIFGLGKPAQNDAEAIPSRSRSKESII